MRLIKRDASANASIEITTYEDLLGFIIYKNYKPIGSASTYEAAIAMHEMFVSTLLFGEVDLNLPEPKYADGTTNRKSNSFLHDFQP